MRAMPYAANRTTLALLAVVATVAIAPSNVGAQAEERASPYHIDLRFDLPVLGLGLAGTALNLVEVPPPGCLPTCDRRDINALDRAVAGNYSSSAHTIADFAVLGLLLLPPILDLVDVRGRGWLADMVVLVESVLVTQAITQLTKFAVRRAAPFVYGSDAPDSERETRDASRSFFSGHTATAFAATTTFSVTFWLRHPDNPWRFVVAAAGALLSTGVGLLKIEAGYHYWTDIAAGALVGSSIGALVPFLHTL